VFTTLALMQIVKESMTIYPESTLPAIRLRVADDVEQDTVPLKIEGCVYAEDEKYIGNLVELPPLEIRSNLRTNQRQERILVSRATELTTPIPGHTNYEHELMFSLDKKSIDHVEEMRHKAKNKNVTLYFTFKSTYLMHSKIMTI
jgi:hypothetical protein